jgi:hypothetical protein
LDSLAIIEIGDENKTESGKLEHGASLKRTSISLEFN